MAVRALITRVDDVEIQGESLLIKWHYLFYGSSVPTPDSKIGELLVAPGTAPSEIKAQIKNIIQSQATALNYGTLARPPQHVDEIFHNL